MHRALVQREDHPLGIVIVEPPTVEGAGQVEHHRQRGQIDEVGGGVLEQCTAERTLVVDAS